MRRLALTLAAAAIMLAAAAPVAAAHELQVLAPGPAELDVGTAVPPRLLHATLLDRTDRLEATVTASDSPLEVLVLVPGRAPEGDRSGDALPSVQVAGAPEAMIANLEEPQERRDAVTGFEYLVLARVTIPPSAVAATVVVARGSEPTRVALRVGPPDAPFEALDADRTPRALTLARAWVETEPAGASDLPRPGRAMPDRRLAWFGLGLAGVGILVAAWWIARGRSTSRRRGVERASSSRRSDGPAG